MYSTVLAAAKRFKIQPSILFGMMQRETNGQNIRGDGGHGRGLMQIDDRSHGAWQRLRHDRVEQERGGD